MSEEDQEEDQEDIEAARKALEEPGPNVPFDEVKKQLGLDE